MSPPHISTTPFMHDACAAAAARTAAKAMRGYALARATNYGLLLNSAHTPHVHVVPTPSLIAASHQYQRQFH